MKISTILSTSFTNLWRRKMRTILTVWGMSVGIGAMVLLISFATGMQKEVRKQFYNFSSLTELDVAAEKQSMSSPSINSQPKSFSEADLTTMRGLPHVQAVYKPTYAPVTSITFGDKTVQTNYLEPTPMERITETRRSQIDRGSWWSTNNDTSVVLSASAVTDLGSNSEALVGKTIRLNTTTYIDRSEKSGKSYDAIVAGILKSNSSSIMNNGSYGNIAYGFAEIINTENVSHDIQDSGLITSVLVYVDSTDNVQTVRKALEDKGWTVRGLEDLLKEIDKGFLIMKIISGVTGGIALFVALIGIANSMLMAILERTREIGILVALGASRRTINKIFLAEASWIGLLGGLVGLGGAWLLGKSITFFIRSYFSSQISSGNFPPIAFSIDAVLLFGTIVGAIFFTLIAAWLPSRRAAKLDPVVALRHE